MTAGDTSFEFLLQAGIAPSIPGFFEAMDTSPAMAKGWKGMSLSFLFADNSGNIGSQLICSTPVRLDRTPYIGLYVLDGRTSAHDWDGNGDLAVPLKELPRGMNPEKGYIVAANGRYTSDHSKTDYGSWSAGTARTIRITELLQAKIDAGVKLTHLDMTEIQ